MSGEKADEEGRTASVGSSNGSVDWEAGNPCLFFQCTSGVFRKDGGSSLCYTTSTERAEWIARQLNAEMRLRAALEKIKQLWQTHSEACADNSAVAFLMAKEARDALSVDSQNTTVRHEPNGESKL